MELIFPVIGLHFVGQKCNLLLWFQCTWNYIQYFSAGYQESIGGLVNSLAPGRFDCSLKWVNLKLISTINILSIICEIAIRWMPQHLTDH